MKKIVKYVPFVTVLLFMINFIITFVDFKSASVFSSTVDGFGKMDIICNFSHVDWDHFLRNMATLLSIGAPMEILLSLRKKRRVYAAILLASVVGVSVLNELFNSNVVGASGWLAAFPVIAMPIVCWFVGTAKGNGKDIVTHPAWILGAYPLLHTIVGLHWDITKLQSGDGIAHDVHLMGYGVGAALFAITAPFVINAWVRKFARMRTHKQYIAARRAELRRKMAAQQAAAMAA